MIKFARPRTGHFDLGTGYHGDVWLDLDALFLRPPDSEPDWVTQDGSRDTPPPGETQLPAEPGPEGSGLPPEQSHD